MEWLCGDDMSIRSVNNEQLERRMLKMEMRNDEAKLSQDLDSTQPRTKFNDKGR